MKTIVVGIDFSKNAQNIFDAALELAQKDEAQLLVISAVGLPVEFPVEALTISPNELPARLLDITQKRLERFVGDKARAGKTRVEARLGSPWQVLCDAAREVKASVIVVGTHGYGALDRLLGTTAARVVNHAPCSVFVVRSAG